MRNYFFHMHPTSCFLFFVAQFVITLVLNHPIILAISFLQAIIFELSIKDCKVLKNIFVFYLPLIIVCGVFNSLFSHYGVTKLFVLFSGNNYTLESLVYGFIFGLKIVALLIWLNCFNEIITPEKFIFLFGRISPRLALVMSMTLRFIPLFTSHNKEIEDARKTLGLSNSDKNIIRRFRNSISNLSILITWILERGIDTANSMSARGYGIGKRKTYNRYKFAIEDIILLLLTIVFVIVCIACVKSLECMYNPMIKFPNFSLKLILFTIYTLFYGAFPLLYNRVEKSIWK